MIKKTFTFGIRDTPKGAVAWMRTLGKRFVEKRFRNGYCSARISAQKWIDEKITVVKEVCEFEKNYVPEFIQEKNSE